MYFCDQHAWNAKNQIVQCFYGNSYLVLFFSLLKKKRCFALLIGHVIFRFFRLYMDVYRSFGCFERCGRSLGSRDYIFVISIGCHLGFSGRMSSGCHVCSWCYSMILGWKKFLCVEQNWHGRRGTNTHIKCVQFHRILINIVVVRTGDLMRDLHLFLSISAPPECDESGSPRIFRKDELLQFLRVKFFSIWRKFVESFLCVYLGSWTNNKSFNRRQSSIVCG